MKKGKNILKKIILVICVLLCTYGVSYAVINDPADIELELEVEGEIAGREWDVEGSWVLGQDSEAGEFINKALEKIGDIAINAAFGSIATTLTLLAVTLFLLLDIVFAGITDSLMYPFPDAVIFNTISIFDPNFTQPDSEALTQEIIGILKSLFASFQSIAIGIFAVVAMILGIKFAITTIATEKAKYKQAVSKWLMGIILLFMINPIMSGVFYLNEAIVKEISKEAADISFTFDVTDMIPTVGATFGELLKDIMDAVDLEATISISGYLGLVLKYLVQGWGGNIYASIVSFVIMGQSIAIIICYFKRLFYSLLLGVISPIVIAVDTVNKALGNQSKAFSTWFKEFTVTVFLQSFHALLLLVVMTILSKIEDTFTLALEGILAIILTSALVKFEKIFKGLFGIRTGMMGDLKGGAAAAFKALHGVRQGVGAVADNGKKLKAASDKKEMTNRQINRLDKKIKAGEAARNMINSTTNTRNTDNSDNSVQNIGEGGYDVDSDGNVLRGPEARALSAGNSDMTIESNGDTVIDSGGSAPALAAGEQAAQQLAAAGGGDAIAQAIAKALRANANLDGTKALNVHVTNPEDIGKGMKKLDEANQQQLSLKSKVPTDEEMEDMYDQMAALKQQSAEAESEYSSALLAKHMGMVNLIAGMGIGLGAEDSISDALLTGGYVTKGLDQAAEKIGYQGARKTRNEMYESTKSEYGIDNAKIKQPKMDITLNPIIKGQKDLTAALEIKNIAQGTMSQDLSKGMRSEIGKKASNNGQTTNNTTNNNNNNIVINTMSGANGGMDSLEIKHIFQGAAGKGMSDQARQEISKVIQDEMQKQNNKNSSTIKTQVEEAFSGYKGIIQKEKDIRSGFKKNNKSVDNID